MRPAAVETRVNYLSACLALVRPVGMGNPEAEEWLAVAATTIDLPEDILETACREARKTCTHHGQIVPAILKEAEQWMGWRRMSRPSQTESNAPQLEHHEWRPEPGELDEIKRQVAESLKAGRD